MKYFILSFIIFFGNVCEAKTYYFSTISGNDSRTSVEAQSQHSPWKTLSKLNSFFVNLLPGDSILLKRGEVYYGQIIVSKSGLGGQPINIGAFGNGLNPILSGFKLLKNWHNVGNGIWETIDLSLPENINVLLINEKVAPIGRFPNIDAVNKGYLTFQNHIQNKKIIDTASNRGQNWTGADIVIRKNRWILDRGVITKHSGTDFFYDKTSSYEPIDNFGYFIQNHLGTLDQTGEWQYEFPTKKISILFNNGLDPNKELIKASSIATMVEIRNFKNLQFSNIIFEGSNNNAFEITGSSNIGIKNCVIKSGLNGIEGSNNNFISLDSLQISNCLNNGISLKTNNSFVTNSIFTTIGIIPGLGNNGDGNYHALIFSGSNNLIEKNIIDSCGYSAISFQSNIVTVRNNYIKNFNLVKDDGGGIYTWNGDYSFSSTSIKIIDNIILNGHATYGASSNLEAHSHGIYMDDNTKFAEIRGNTVSFCNGSGLYIHNSSFNVVQNNTFFGNRFQLLMNQHSSYQLGNNEIKKNIFFSKYSTEMAVILESDLSNLKYFARFDSNYYCRPIDDKFIINKIINSPGVYNSEKYMLKQWKKLFHADSASKGSPLQFSAYSVNSLTGVNKISNGIFSKNISGVSCWSAFGNCQTGWTRDVGLDAGCLKIRFDKSKNLAIQDRNALISINIGNVNSGKSYILKFSLLGKTNLSNIKVFLRQVGAPYTDLSQRFYCNIDTKRIENEFAFVSPISEMDACLVFELNEEDSVFFADNFELYEANLSITDPNSFLRFEYNATNNYKKVDLENNAYLDNDNRFYYGSTTLAPWSSLVLVKTKSNVLQSSELELNGKLIYDIAKLRWKIPNLVPSKRFIIEKSINGRDFIELAYLESLNLPKEDAYYSFDDISPYNGNNYYRVKLIDFQNRVKYSNIIIIKNEIKQPILVFPNPTKGVIFLNYPSQIYKGASLRISSITGVFMERRKIIAYDKFMKIDISLFPKGYYILEIKNGTESSNYKILKQ